MFKRLTALLVAGVMVLGIPIAAGASRNKAGKNSKFHISETERFKEYARISSFNKIMDKRRNSKSKDEREIKMNIEKYLNAAAQNSNFHGTVLVEKAGKVILAKGYGMANYENSIPNTTSTRFAIGSMTKQFTAMAIMQLLERGKLKLDDKLIKYFPDFPRGEEITIHHLLTHTSGIANYTNLAEYWALDPENVSEDIILNLFKNKPLEFNPGENWNYSNSGYFLLGVIVEKITGKSLDSYWHKNIFEPLKMKNTGILYKKGKKMIDTVGYVGYLDIQPIDDLLTFKTTYGAGCLYSTVGDMFIWDRALYTCKLASKKTMDMIFSPQVDTKAIGYYGYGWVIQGEGKDKEIFHDGALLGFSSIISRYVERNTGIIILTNNNSNGSGIFKIKSDINSILLGKEVDLPVEKKAITLDAEIIDGLVGNYEIAPGLYCIITREENHVYAQITGQEKIEVFPESDTKFFYRIVDAQITFVKDTNDRLEGLIINQNGASIQAKRIEDDGGQVLQQAA
ncbi:serine hydrolase [Pseudobacteroides cellulosolvens]|uniref:Beta-lactamase n=1 Tax=Pseudobacteroides cellulosolvens ATCC 35603 = DSM 2933 TaxID=398512 RepID=A0A0L6JUB4_9FIRM|nr:serine hydrolase [Pseudobacteroides cellulosolvens]KNY29309.1 beta-lactamase [Pseudobacteroides cellulosolvens ATCC 35603 = DSM 2933]